jgi:hypothetical protein
MKVLMNARAAVLLSLNLCLVLSPVPLRAWTLDSGRHWSPVALAQLKPAPPSAQALSAALPSSAPPADLFSGAFGVLTASPVSLSGGQVTISAGGRRLWSSPPAWRVTQVESADLNRDGLVEVVMLVWRPFRPWPVDASMPSHGRIDSFQNAAGQSCQLILIGWKDGRFKEVWAGSALSHPLTAFTAADLDGDGRAELLTLDSDYTDPPGAPAASLSAWEWNGFGFTLLDRRSGRFTQLAQAGARPTALPGSVLLTTP